MLKKGFPANINNLALLIFVQAFHGLLTLP